MNKYVKPMCPICSGELYMSVPVFGQRNYCIGKTGKVLKRTKSTSSLDEGEGELCCWDCGRAFDYKLDKNDRIILEK